MRRRLVLLAFTGLVSLTAAGALAQAEAERQLDAAIERLRVTLGEQARITWGDRQIDPVSGRARLADVLVIVGERRAHIAELVLQNVTDSRLGRAELRNLRLEENKGETLELARLVVGGLPLPGPDGFDLASLDLGSLDLESLRAANPEGRLTLARFSAEGYVPGALGTARIEGLQFQAGSNDDGSSFRLGRLVVTGVQMPVIGAELDPRSFAVQSLVLEAGGMRDPDSEVDIEVGRLSVRDWVRGRPTEFAGEALRLGVPAGPIGAADLRIARVAGRGIEAAGVLSAMIEGVQIPDPQAATPQSLVIEGLSLTGDGRPVASLDRIAADGSVDAGGVITGGLALENFRAAVPRGMVDPLDELGYQEVIAAFELRGTLRREGGVMNIQPFRFGVEQAGTLTVTAGFTGIPVPAPGSSTAPDSLLAQVTETRLAGLTVGWREQGLLGRLLAQQARAQRIPEARLREQWAQMALTMPIPGMAPAPAVARGRPAGPPVKGSTPGPAPVADAFTPVREALAAFIRQPRAIEISLRPIKPVTFAVLQSVATGQPAEAVRQLGISARLP